MAFVESWKHVQGNLIWVIRNGQNVKFWKDCWIPGHGALIDLVSNDIPPEVMDFPVYHYARDGAWDWSTIQRYVPAAICDKIATVCPPTPGIDDFPCWKSTSSGAFSLKSAYELLSHPNIDTEDANPLFKKVWQWRGPSRVKAFLWKVTHAKLMTNEERRRRGMTACDLCPRCQTNTESVMHMLRDCEDVKNWWTNIIDPELWSKFFSMGSYSWLDWNLSTNDIGGADLPWPGFFGLAINELWKDRNSLVFNQSSQLGRQMCYQLVAQTNFFQLHQKMPSRGVEPHRVIDVAWKAPPDGCVTMNVDGSFIANSDSSAFGCLARDSRGRFIKGLYGKVGSCNATWAELWALRKGIHLARSLKLPWVSFEMDSKFIVDMVHSGSTHISFLQPLLQEVISYLQNPDWRTSVVHIYREANQCADLLAKQGHAASFDGVMLDYSFPALSLLLLNDVRGVSSPRLVG